MGGRTRSSNSQSAGERRRDELRAAARRQRLIVGGAVGALLIAVVIIGVGLYVTQYLPPRAHVLTTGDRDYDAGAVARRGTYHLVFEGGLAGRYGQIGGLSDIARRATDLLIDEEVLRQRAPATVGEVTAADIEAALRDRFGLSVAAEDPLDADVADDGTPTVDADGDVAEDAEDADVAGDGTPAVDADGDGDVAEDGDDAGAAGDGTPASDAAAEGDTGDGTPEADAAAEGDTGDGTPEADAAANGDDAAYAEAVRDLLRASGLSLDELDALMSAQILIGRLRDGFRADFGATAPQLRLSRVRVDDEEMADEVRDRALAGEDFGALAQELSLDEQLREVGGDLGWFPLELLPDELAATVSELDVGEIAPPVASGVFFDVYLVTERDSERDLDDASLAEFAELRLEDWFNAERGAVVVELELSPDQEQWIIDRVVADATRIASG